VRAPGLGRLVSNILPGATAVTGVLMLVNGLMYLAVMLLPTPSDAGGPTGLSRLFSFDVLSLLRFGAGFRELTFGFAEWWRLVTPIFLHGGLLHFAFNSIGLLQLGPLIEEEFGTERFAFQYLACGIAGNVVSQTLSGRPTVGASGALFGLMGILLIHGYRRGGAYGDALRRTMWGWLVPNLIITFLGGAVIDWRCHLGGLACGLVLGFVVPSGPFRNRATAVAWEALALAALAVTLVAFYLMAAHGEEGVAMLRARYGL
jgi:rhomboid protease GluP